LIVRDRVPEIKGKCRLGGFYLNSEVFSKPVGRRVGDGDEHLDERRNGVVVSEGGLKGDGESLRGSSRSAKNGGSIGGDSDSR